MKKRFDPYLADLIYLMLILFILVGCIYTFSGCSTASIARVNEADVYQLELDGYVDGIPFHGHTIGKQASSHQIKIVSKHDVNLFTVESCHRFAKIEDVIKTGWFMPNRGYDYFYNMSPAIEDEGSCLLRLGAYTKEVGAPQANAIIDFYTPNETLPARNICDGKNEVSFGVSICESKSDLIERIEFDTPVTAGHTDKSCAGSFVTPFIWQYKMPLGECVVAFREVAFPNRLYRHTARGFNKFVYSGSP